MNKLDLETKRSRYNAAQDVSIDWKDILDENIYKSLSNCALNTGTPIDFFMLPLLTVSASLMNGANMLANEKTSWREPSILWTIVNAPAGSRKSAAMSVLSNAVNKLYNTKAESLEDTVLAEDSLTSAPDTSSHNPPQPYMINSVFTMPSLTAKIAQNDGQFLLMFDEMSLLFKNIDKDSKDSPMRQVFLSLNNGAPMTRSTVTCGEETIPKTIVNFCGYIQPDVLFSQLQRGDSDGFLARMLILSPKRVLFKYDDYGNCEGALPMSEIMEKIQSYHANFPNTDYKFCIEALGEFKVYFDTIQEESISKDPFSQAEESSVMNKAMGQCARLCMVMQALSNAADGLSSTIVTKRTAMAAIKLTKGLVESKLALVRDTVKPTITKPPTVLTIDDIMSQRDKLKAALLQPIVSARQLVQSRAVAKTSSGRCTTEDAKAFILSLASHGFGSIQTGARNAVSLKRKRYEEMEPEAQRMVDGLDMDIEIFHNILSADVKK